MLSMYFARTVSLALCLLTFAAATSQTLAATPAKTKPVSCTCGFTAQQRAVADRELWLNRRDKKISVDAHLPWGLPQQGSDLPAWKLLVQRDYVVGYDPDLLIPIWSGHRITKATLDARERANERAKKAAEAQGKKVSRKSCFRPDPRVNSRQSAQCENYTDPGTDQGHLVPDADMPARPVASLVNSYVFSNIAPQHCHFNRGIWLVLEGLAREWARQTGRVYVISGAIFDKDKDGRRDPASDADRLRPNRFARGVAMATHFYKIFLRDDETSELEAIAIVVPHTEHEITRAESREYLAKHFRTVNEVEALSGIDLPPNVKGARNAPGEAVERFLASEFWELEKNKRGEDIWPQMFDAACAK